jgi:hypothetical protein
MNYYEKYLKYKQKYLELKGAGNISGPVLNKDKSKQIQTFDELKNKSLQNHEFKTNFWSILHQQKKNYQDYIPLPFNARILKEKGFTARELINQLNFNILNLKDAGFTANDFTLIIKELIEAKHTIDKLIRDGYDLSDFRLIGAKYFYKNGVTVSQLKIAGFNANELKTADISNQQLKDAGFNASELKFLGAKTLIDLGFTIKQLKDANFTVEDLYKADVRFTVMKEAGYTVSDFKSHEMIDPTVISSLGFSKQEALDGGYTEDELKFQTWQKS